MNLKKIGSALTAISMIASMATYVPFSASAAETPDTVYTGTLDYYPDVAYSLNVTKDILTLSPSVAGATYEIPATVLEEVAYEFVGETTEETYGTAAQVAAEAVTINIEGKAVIDVDESGDITGTSETTSVKADCRAVIKTADSTPVISAVTNEKLAGISASTATVEVEVTHDYQPNKTYHNHVCANCSKVDNSFEAHNFGEGATIDETNHTHTCECGKVDTDYLVTDESGVISDSTGNYKRIHKFDGTNHYCLTCGAYDKIQHQGSNLTYSVTATTHTITCNKTGDTDCAYAETTQKHTFVPYYSENNTPKELGVNTSGKAIRSGEHYCSVCGYVPRDTEGDVTNGSHYTGAHDYSYKFVSYVDEEGDFQKKIVPATAASEKVVCACGAVKPGHGDSATTEADKHNYVGANGMHLCICGDTTAEHNFCYNFNGKGAYTVNGVSGFVKVTDGTGAVCACGELNPGGTGGTGKHVHASAVSEDGVYTDTTAHKHYCSCGQVIMSKGEEVHDYTYQVKDEKHMCSCGAVDETAHKYANDDASTYYIVAYNKTTQKNELVEMKNGGTYSNYQVSSTDDTPISFDNSKAVICACGKVDPAHVCKFNVAAMCIDGVHYCTCGAASTEHTYSTTTHRCTICNEYEEHVCEPTSLNNCACKICGKPVHELIKYGTDGHICSRCGKYDEEVAEHVYKFDTTNHKHICSICGYTATGADVHRYGKEGTAKCICQDCGYVNHSRKNGDNPQTNDVTEKHYCLVCDADLSDVHVYNTMSNTTCTCGAVDPKHVCAFDHVYSNGSSGVTTEPAVRDEVCKCGKKLAHEFEISSESTHTCVHVNNNTPDDGSDDVKCGQVEKHTYDTATNTFCTVCGAVNFTTNKTNAKVITDKEAFDKETTNYTTDYIVKLTKAYNAVEAYYFTKSAAKTLVAKTAAEQTTFNNLVKEFNTLYAAKNDYKSGCMATIKFATGCDSMAESPAADTVVYGQKGDALTLKVVPKSGYKFVGWYDADPNAAASTAKLLSTDAEYVVTASEGNTDYYAKLDKNDTVDIEIGEGISYSSVSGITTAGNGVGAQVGFVLNEKVKVSYTPSGDKFLYFYDNNGNTYNGTLNGSAYVFEFSVSGSITSINVKTTKLSNTDVFVVFKGSADDKSTAVRTRAVKKSAASDPNATVNLSADAPTSLPGRIGKDFIGWAIDGQWGKSATKTEPVASDVVKIKQVKVGVANTLTLVPVYKNQTGFQLTIVNGSFVNASADQIKNGFTYNDKVGITAPEKDAKTGKYFSGWYVNDVFYSITRTTYYTVKGNDTIVAKYENDEPAEDISYLTISSTTSTDTGVRVVNLAAKWSLLTKDYSEVLDSGYVFSFTGKTAADLTLENVDNSTVRKKVVGETAMTGSTNYPLTLKSDATKNATVTAVAYLTVRDANGNVKTIYSDNMVTAMP